MKHSLKQAHRRVKLLRHKLESHLRRKAIDRILQRSEKPCVLDDTPEFAKLQAKYSCRDIYKYDSLSLWRRGCTRLESLLEIDALLDPGQRVLDVGAGDGMLGCVLNAYGHKVDLFDQEDWRDGRAKCLPLALGDCNQLPYPDGRFDVVCSYNSFEHFPTPDVALSEMRRVVKDGGIVVIEFNPLYCSPWGLHAYRTLHMPYCQFLFSDGFILSKLGELGVRDLGGARDVLQYVNKWRVQEFGQLWSQAGMEDIVVHYQRDFEHLNVVLKYPFAFQGRGLAFDDLVTSGERVVFKNRK